MWADALSRLSCKENNISQVYAELYEENNDLEETTQVMRKFIEDHLINIEGVEYFKENGNFRKCINDTAEKIQLIKKAHDVGQEGVKKTYERLKPIAYWKNMIIDIKKYIGICKNCQMRRPPRTKELMENRTMKVEAPFVRIGLDIIGPLPVTTSGNKYIIVIVYYFTKWVEAKPVSTVTAKDVVNFLIESFSRYGFPQVINTDNGRQFIADYNKIFMDLFDVYIQYVCPYHPESNGMVENRNREIGKFLRLLANEEMDWDELFPIALWALRTTKNDATGFSSFELMYGRQIVKPMDIEISEEYNVEKSKEEILMNKYINHYKWVKEAATNMRSTLNYWRTRRIAQQNMKNVTQYKVGDKIKIRNIFRKKLDPYYVGPYTIKSIDFNTVTVEEDATGKIQERKVHVKNILPFNDNQSIPNVD